MFCNKHIQQYYINVFHILLLYYVDNRAFYNTYRQKGCGEWRVENGVESGESGEWEIF